MNGRTCHECQWIGTEPETHTRYGDPASGEAYRVVIETCPDCGHDELDEASICEECELFEAEPGYDECRECLAERAECEGEFRRDMERETRLLVKA